MTIPELELLATKLEAGGLSRAAILPILQEAYTLGLEAGYDAAMTETRAYQPSIESRKIPRNPLTPTLLLPNLTATVKTRT